MHRPINAEVLAAKHRAYRPALRELLPVQVGLQTTVPARIRTSTGRCHRHCWTGSDGLPRCRGWAPRTSTGCVHPDAPDRHASHGGGGTQPKRIPVAPFRPPLTPPGKSGNKGGGGGGGGGWSGGVGVVRGPPSTFSAFAPHREFSEHSAEFFRTRF